MEIKFLPNMTETTQVFWITKNYTPPFVVSHLDLIRNPFEKDD